MLIKEVQGLKVGDIFRDITEVYYLVISKNEEKETIEVLMFWECGNRPFFGNKHFHLYELIKGFHSPAKTTFYGSPKPIDLFMKVFNLFSRIEGPCRGVVDSILILKGDK